MALCRHALGSPSSTRRSLQVPVVVISTASYSALPQGVNPVYRSGDRACFLQRPSSTSPPLRPGLHSSTVLRAAPVVIDDAAAQHPEPATKLPVTVRARLQSSFCLYFCALDRLRRKLAWLVREKQMRHVSEINFSPHGVYPCFWLIMIFSMLGSSVALNCEVFRLVS